MDEIYQFIKTAKEPQELKQYTTLLYDAFCISDKTHKEIEKSYDDTPFDVFF